MSAVVGSLLPPAERSFGDFELISKLATGGMAEILLARRKSDGELLVVKRVLSRLEHQARFIAMFRDEGRLASQIVHPNVCRVFKCGAVESRDFIAMEYLHGVPLSRILIRAARTKQPLEVGIAVAIIMQCARGLHHAHELRTEAGRLLEVVHRDVSPPNIFVTSEGVTKMLDFGVAKAQGATQRTRAGTVKGKNSYMSPEQILGEQVDRRSDVFSLGIVLWEALAAKRLFNRDTDFATFTAITKTDIPAIQRLRSDVSDALAAVLDVSLAQNRDERYFTAQEFHDALANALDGHIAADEAVASYLGRTFAKEMVTREEFALGIAQEMAVASVIATTTRDAGSAPPTHGLAPTSRCKDVDGINAGNDSGPAPSCDVPSSRVPLGLVIFILALVGGALAVAASLLSS